MRNADADQVSALAHQVVAEQDPKQVPVTEFLGACYDAGLSWVHFPEGLGGLGLSRGLQAVADGILRQRDAQRAVTLHRPVEQVERLPLAVGAARRVAGVEVPAAPEPPSPDSRGRSPASSARPLPHKPRHSKRIPW